jgi:hypothetical protein
MNSIQLSQRLARNLNVPDVFNLPADAALDVLAAMNAGLASYYRETPGIYKRTTLSHTIRAPRALTINFQAQYSRVVADDTFSINDQGCTVRFGNGSADNVVTGANNLLDDYLGTVLSTPATLYSDSIPIQDVIERVIGYVRLYDNTQSQPTFLVRDERLRGGKARHWVGGGALEDVYYPCDGVLSNYTIGRPRYYYLDPMGASQGAEPEFLLRVAPLPDIDYTVRMEAELSTQRLIFTDLQTARAIHVRDTDIDDILIPLCEAELVTSSFWRDKEQAKGVLTRSENVLATKMPKMPRDVAPVSNRVGTPRGF